MKLPKRKAGSETQAQARRARERAAGKLTEMPGPSPNPATNLLIADIAHARRRLLMRPSDREGLLGARIAPDKAAEIVKGRTMAQTLAAPASRGSPRVRCPGACWSAAGCWQRRCSTAA